MKAAVLHGVGQPLRVEERAEPRPGPGEVVVALKAAALNRRDYWITQGLYPGIRCPVVLGSDGAGVVHELGPNVAGQWKGREVLIYPGWNWGPDNRVQGPDLQVLGMPEDGTFAELVRVRAEQLYPKPDFLSWEEAAAWPLAGVTAYRAVVVQAAVRSGQRVLVTGTGGVATAAVQLARACGATVLVTSSSERKLAAVRQLGAEAGYLYTDPDWSKRLKAEQGPVDVAIDGAGGELFNRLLELAAPGGTIVSYGATAGRPPDVDLYRVFWKQLRLQGSTFGSPDDFRQMMRLVEQRRMRPAVDRVFPLSQVNQALARMRDGQHVGKIVLRIG